MRLYAMILWIAVLISACTNSPNQEKADLEAQLTALEKEAWQGILKDSLYFRMKLGLPINSLPDISEAKARKDIAFYDALGLRLENIPAENLDGAAWLSRHTLAREIKIAREFMDHFWMPFMGTPYGEPSFEAIHQALGTHQFQNQDDCTRYLDLLDQYQRLVVQLHARFETQTGRGIVMPAVQIDPVIEMYRSLVNEEAAKSPVWVADARLASLDDATLSSFDAEITTRITEKINPALVGLIDYLDGDYRTNAPDAVGCAQYPGGKAYYEFLVKLHTTMDVTPDQVHQNGLDAVARLEQRIASLMDKLGYSCTRDELRDELNKDPRFFVDTPEKVGEHLMKYIHALEPGVSDFFQTLPKAPYGVARLHPSLEGSMTFGYYQWPTAANPRGTYMYNGSQLEERSLLTAESLIYHELVPGHHFQLAIVDESETLSEFRKYTFHTAFVEGWAEYASGMAREMGGYQDPYDDLGRCFAEMFFAVRLVVDTGMNAKGWTRAQAMDYMRKHLLESETQIQSESLRYSVLIPGQALAYRMGAEKIRELRRRSEEKLGDSFDIRRFHALVLENGSLPMTVLEKNVDRFIKNGG